MIELNYTFPGFSWIRAIESWTKRSGGGHSIIREHHHPRSYFFYNIIIVAEIMHTNDIGMMTKSNIFLLPPIYHHLRAIKNSIIFMLYATDPLGSICRMGSC
ncbi:hypothetical protein ACJX0J_033422, partial [Zea mays]